jgi:cardiolipin synthase (CMP-forming)
VSIANLISLARLLSVPIAIWFILDDALAAAFWLFVAAGLSDAVDGFIAKRFDQRSSLGALLDPIADKTLLVSMFVTLGLSNRLPSWVVILVVFRDLLIIGGFLLAMVTTQRMRFEPLWISKLNTTLQIVLIATVLGRLGLEVSDRGLGTVLIYAVAATTILSGAGYLVRWARSLAGAELGS